MDIDPMAGTSSGSAQPQLIVPRSAPHNCGPLSEDKQKEILGDSILAFRDISASALAGLYSHFTPTAAAANRLIDLEKIVGVLADTETFFPKRIFVRDCMMKVFKLIANDKLTINGNRVLLGSPGVGKSVLFFICALCKAEIGDKPVVYFRKTREEKRISVFVLLRTQSGVRFFSCRRLKKDKFDKISHYIDAVAACFGLDPDDECVVFLDGPKHDEEKDLNATYHYLCTSGGHPLPKNAQKELYLWILDAWSEQEAISGLTALSFPPEDVRTAYMICGGCVRDMYGYLSGDDPNRALMVSTLDALSERVGHKEVDVVLTTTTRNNDDDSGNPDRLRAMFNGESTSEHMPKSIQIVDSKYVMRILRGRIGLGKLLEAMKLGETIKSGTVVGVYFEEILHRWFLEHTPEGIEGVLASTGNTAQGVTQLIQTGIYWMPSVPNFPNIDAAVILGKVLFAFQYTKRFGHDFVWDVFWQDFVEKVREWVEFDAVHVFIVLKDKVTSTLQVNNRGVWTQSSGTRASAVSHTITCTSSHVTIDTTSIDSICKSAAAGFTFEQAAS